MIMPIGLAYVATGRTSVGHTPTNRQETSVHAQRWAHRARLRLRYPPFGNYPEYSAILHRQVLERAVRYLHGQGIDQFLDLGSGLPTSRNTHEIAQELNPRALVAYVDNDPIVLTHARAQPASSGRSCRRSGAAGCAAGMRSPPSSTASSWWSRASSSCPSGGRTGRPATRSTSAAGSFSARWRARTRPKTA